MVDLTNPTRSSELLGERKKTPVAAKRPLRQNEGKESQSSVDQVSGRSRSTNPVHTLSEANNLASKTQAGKLSESGCGGPAQRSPLGPWLCDRLVRAPGPDPEPLVPHCVSQREHVVRFGSKGSSKALEIRDEGCRALVRRRGGRRHRDVADLPLPNRGRQRGLVQEWLDELTGAKCS